MALLAAPAFGQNAAAGQHPKTHYIEVEPDVRLEVLDWGGSGPAVVLLAGAGDTRLPDFPLKVVTLA